MVSLVEKLLNKIGHIGVVDQRITLVLQVELVKLLIRKNSVLRVFEKASKTRNNQPY